MWSDDAVLLTRAIIGDFTEPYVYYDDRLFDLFLFGCKLVLLDVSFAENFSINLNSSTITPAPDSNSGIITLGALRAGVLIANSEYKAKAAGAVTIVDGPSTINLAASATAFKARVDQLQKDYDKAKMQYVFGQGRGYGIVITPTTSNGSGPENIYTSPRFQYVPYSTYQLIHY